MSGTSDKYRFLPLVFIGLGIYFLICGLFIPKWLLKIRELDAFSEVIGVKGVRILSIILGSAIIILMLIPIATN